MNTIDKIKSTLKKEGFLLQDHNYKKYPLVEGKEYRSYLKFTLEKGDHFVLVLIYDNDKCKMAHIEGYTTKEKTVFNSLEEFLTSYRKYMIEWQLDKKMSA